MTHVKVTMKSGHMTIEAVDHAGDPRVCAAISAILQTAVLGLEAIAAEHPQHLQVHIQPEGAITDENQTLAS